MEKHYKVSSVVYLSLVEYKRWIRNSKMIILPVLIIVVKNLITDNLVEASIETKYRLSFLEPFTALTNSGVILLLMPLAFMVLMTDYPQKSLLDGQILMRTTKRQWCFSQILFALYASVSFVLVMLVSTVILVIGHSDLSFDFSKGITGYDQIFFEREYGIINELLPRNLFNQVKLSEAFVSSLILLISYFFLLELVLLFGTIIGKRKVAVIADVIMSVAGVAFIETRGQLQWLFPITHTVVWIHFREYYSAEIFPMWGSFAYLLGGCVLLTVLCAIVARKYNIRDSE